MREGGEQEHLKGGGGGQQKKKSIKKLSSFAEERGRNRKGGKDRPFRKGQKEKGDSLFLGKKKKKKRGPKRKALNSDRKGHQVGRW